MHERWLFCAALFGALIIAPAKSSASNCAYYQEAYENYRGGCSSYDGCANIARMEAMVRAECGPATDDTSRRRTVEALNAQRARIAETLDATRRAEALATQRQEEYHALMRARTPSGAQRDCPLFTFCLDGYRCCIEPQQCRDGEPLCPGVSWRAWLNGTPPSLEEALALRWDGNMPEAERGGPLGACADDNRLLRQDVLAVRNAVLKRKQGALREGIEELRRLKVELENEARWIGPWREVLVYVIKPLDMAGRLFENTLAIDPRAGRVIGVASALRTATGRFLVAVRAGRRTFEFWPMLEDTIEQFYFAFLLDVSAQRSRTAAAMKAIYDLTAGIEELSATPDGFRSARKEITRQIGMVEAQIENLEVKLRATQHLREAVERFAAEVEAAGAGACQPTLAMPKP